MNASSSYRKIYGDSLITFGGKSELWHGIFLDNSRALLYLVLLSVKLPYEKNKQIVRLRKTTKLFPSFTVRLWQACLFTNKVVSLSDTDSVIC